MTQSEIFDTLLAKFNALVAASPKADSIKSELDAIKLESAKLSGRQRMAIVERCDNYMAGDYGKTKN